MEKIFFCSGTLVSSSKVVTGEKLICDLLNCFNIALKTSIAAHCLYEKDHSEPKRARDILLFFGVHDLDDPSGTFSQTPFKIIIHDDWNPFVKSFDADIALLFTEDEITLTKLIQPICLWEFSNLPNVDEGIIAGWGKHLIDGAGYEKVPRQLKIPIKPNQETCFLGNPAFTKIASTRTFCGGSRTGEGPCRGNFAIFFKLKTSELLSFPFNFSGDSGSGMFIKHNNIFFLRGIVSASLFDVQGNCDVTNYAIYTNVQKFTAWIKDPTKRNSCKPTTELFNVKVEEPSCGIMSGSTSLIQGGTFASSTLFPWTVAVYNYAENPDKDWHLATGTLISKRHVIVGANYVVSKNDDTQLAEDFIMYFGAFNLDRKKDPGVVSSGVSKIIPHEKYKQDPFPREANFAILIADKIIEFSNQIHPVCLSPYRDNSDDIIDDLSASFAVGWGYDESLTHTKEKKFIQLKTDIKIRCEANYRDELKSVTFSKFFCSTATSDGSPCWSDTPLYMKTGDKWFLRGMLAMAYYWPNRTCDVGSPLLYEDLSFYANWIESKISSP
jgi:hypothetical protein